MASPRLAWAPKKKNVPLHETVTSALAWTKNLKLGVGGPLMVLNDVLIPRKCFAKISELKKKLGEGNTCFFYNGICNGKNLQQSKIFILGTKTHLYELICLPHIEEDQTKPVFLIKKNQFNQEKLDLFENLDFWRYNRAPL